jgi:hypothetical protein
MADNDRRDLVAQMKNRALVYLEMYDVLEAELGAAKAEELLTRAIYRRGRAMGAGWRSTRPPISTACARRSSARCRAARASSSRRC